jgi:manganese-dependent inorganic pyrophosphatase
MNKDIIYVFGHKNPDTDSICAALSLSYLKNQLGMKTIPATLGKIAPETKYALDKFGFKHIYLLNDVKLQIKDVEYHRNCFIDKNLSLKDAFDYMSKYKLTGIPIVENKNNYFGYVSLKEVAKELINGDYHKIETSYGNLLNVLKGEKVLKFDKEISGTVIAATYAKETFIEKVNLNNDSILIVGDRKAILEYAIDNKVKLIIQVAGASIHNDLLKKARENKINIIKTKLNSYEVGKLISLSNYIKNSVRQEETITFKEMDYLKDFLDKSKTLKHTNYPILNNKNECKGLLTLTDTNNVNRKKVILVDHNNYNQSVDGLDEADIIEVIDHHNIGDIVTKRPINFRNSNCGCVSTMIYEMFNENNIEIPKEYAGILASAIISDTLLLTSPTTTQRDVDALERLAYLARINYQEYGKELLKHGMSIKGFTNEEILYKDFKSYKVEDNLIGVGQVLTNDLTSIRKKYDELVAYMDEVAKKDNYRVLTLFITDVFKKVSYCLYNKQSEDFIKEAFGLDSIEEGVELKGVISRKTQIAPNLMDVLD